MQAAEMLGESSLLLPVEVSFWVAFEISWNTVIAEQNVYYFISIAHFTTKIFPHGNHQLYLIYFHLTSC